MPVRSMIGLLATIAFLGGGLCAQAWCQSDGGCYSIVVGKDASASGSVFMAHNEDDFIPQIVNHRKIPRHTYAPGATVKLDSNLTLEQVPETWAYLWSEIPGLLYSDSYLNEWGVCVCSDACQSREDKPSLTGSGISSTLRRLIAERAKTSRQGVHIAGDLVEKFGYAGSGRTYIISDPNEGWLFCAVNGRHWVAQRVPDDQVALIANSYTVQNINLADTLNFLGSSDIITYATERGWYDPKTDGAFNFAKAYADPQNVADPRNIGRQWDGIRLMAAQVPPYGDPLPFSVRPAEKVVIRRMMAVLRDHYDNTPLYAVDSSSGCPHGNPVTPICRHDTQTSFIAELRGNMPREIGLLYWVCLSSPCASCYVPFYFGAESFPDAYAGASTPPTEDEYAARVGRPFAVDPGSAFWTFTCLRDHLERGYTSMFPQVRSSLDAVEFRTLAKQAAVERQAFDLIGKDRAKALGLLSGYSLEAYEASMKALGEIGK